MHSPRLPLLFIINQASEMLGSAPWICPVMEIDTRSWGLIPVCYQVGYSAAAEGSQLGAGRHQPNDGVHRWQIYQGFVTWISQPVLVW